MFEKEIILKKEQPRATVVLFQCKLGPETFAGPLVLGLDSERFAR